MSDNPTVDDAPMIASECMSTYLGTVALVDSGRVKFDSDIMREAVQRMRATLRTIAALPPAAQPEPCDHATEPTPKDLDRHSDHLDGGLGCKCDSCERVQAWRQSKSTEPVPGFNTSEGEE